MNADTPPRITLRSQQQQEAFAAALAAVLPRHVVIFLVGELGAGKTTLVRGILRGFGWSGTVKSPTYTLLEPYELQQRNVYHFDLYRLADAEELEYLGIRELIDAGMLLFEWPDRGEGLLPAADITINIEHLQCGRVLTFTVENPQLQQRVAAVITSFEHGLPASPAALQQL